jgi:hypothetical protein
MCHTLSCRVELRAFLLRILMTCINVLVYDAKWASGAQLLLSCILTYQLWYWQPQLEGWANHVRTGAYTSVAWCSLLYVISAFNLGGATAYPTKLPIGGCVRSCWPPEASQADCHGCEPSCRLGCL